MSEPDALECHERVHRMSVNLKKLAAAFAGETRVVDTESGNVIFTYRPEYDQNIHPVRIEKIDANHRQVVFEAPKR